MSLKSVCLIAIAALAGFAIAQQAENPDLGFKDTPYLPNQKWHVHDPDRPHPLKVTPATPSTQQRPGQPPSDAIVLFDGKDLSHWVNIKDGKEIPPRWKLENGYVAVVDGAGDLVSKEKFGDAQYHVEWAEPANIQGRSQARGNSGFIIQSRYEIQVLDCFDNLTYADGQAGAIYGQFPPLVNPCRKTGEWQTYDIVFEAPRFENDRLIKPAYVTVFFNGVLVHNHQPLIGRMVYRQVATYAPHAEEEPLSLQDHHNAVRYRNIWVRRLTGYDQPEKK
jgi:hypothetical protein